MTATRKIWDPKLASRDTDELRVQVLPWFSRMESHSRFLERQFHLLLDHIGISGTSLAHKFIALGFLEGGVVKFFDENYPHLFSD